MDFLILLYIAGFVGTLVSLFYLLNYSIIKEKEIKKEIKEYPKVAIIVPAFNEEKNIKETIISLSKLDYPKDKLKIIVVDDGSKDKTFEIAKKTAEKINKRFKYNLVEVYKKENGGKASALNFGIRKVLDKVKYIVCMDADSIVMPYSLKKMVEKIENLPEEYVACISAMNVHNPKTIHQKFQAIEYYLNNALRKMFNKANMLYVTPGPFSLYKSEFFKKYGLFKEHITEDAELGVRIQANGKRIYFVEDSLVYTKTPESFKALVKQRTRWYLGGIDVQMSYFKKIIKHNKFLAFTIFVPFWFYIIYSPILLYYTTKDYIKEIFFFFKRVFLAGFDYYYVIKYQLENFEFNFSLLSFHVTYFYFFLSILFLFIYLLIAKKTIKKEDIKKIKTKKYGNLFILFLPILFTLVYGFYFLVFYLSVLYYKILGKELRFGNVVWKNSFLEKIKERLLLKSSK